MDGMCATRRLWGFRICEIISDIPLGYDIAGYCSCKEGDNFVHVVGLRAGEPNKLCQIPKGGHSEQFKILCRK